MAGSILLGLLGPSCARYHPEPIAPQRSLEEFATRRLDSPELGTFLREHQEVDGWPPTAWNLQTLTLAAFYYSPELDVARAQWAVAQGGIITAGARPNPTATGSLGYNASSGGVAPWIPDFVLDLPIEVAGKRGIRITWARHASEAARLNLLTTAWQVRSRVRQSFLDLYLATEADSLLRQQEALLAAAAGILEAQRIAGEVSPALVTQARIALANSRVAALDAAQTAARARSALAVAVGIPPEAVDAAQLSFEELRGVPVGVPAAEVRRRALLGRSDVLGALSEYEATQAALQLEIRQQYPDLTLGSGYQLDQTDTKWTLGVGLTLPMLNRNQGPIAEAAARREEAAARFLSLQSTVLGEVESAVASYLPAVEQVQAADSLLEQLQRRERQAATAYRLGETSRLELLGVQSEALTTALARLDALGRAQRAMGALEDAMQTPLDVGAWVLEPPRDRLPSQESRR